jgi:hypothetical protein
LLAACLALAVGPSVAAGQSSGQPQPPGRADGAPPKAGLAVDKVPIPHQVHSRAKPLGKGRTALVAFDTAPFPYDGIVPRTGRPFLETGEDGRKLRRTAGRVLAADEVFGDNRVLLHLPEGFDARRPGLIIVFFHGHGATVGDDVFLRQKVPAQLAGTNAVLVAPQLAVKAADSSAGKLWQPGGFARFVGEAASNLARLHGDTKTARSFAAMPVVIVAYSGGYVAAAWSAHHGGLGKRLRGIVLLDALYGEIDKFEAWIAQDPTRIFVSAYTSSTARGNAALRRRLDEREIRYRTTEELGGTGNLVFVATGSGSKHRDFVTNAWSDYPLADLLGRLDGYTRR